MAQDEDQDADDRAQGDEEPFSLAQPYGPRASTCGYCGPPGGRSLTRSSFTFGIDAVQLSCLVYQRMIDRGWRRSGTYCYKPDLKRSCCPQYSIRLDVKQFKPSRSQRKVLYRFNRFVLGEGEGEASETGATDGGASNTAGRGPPKSKKNKGKDFSPSQSRDLPPTSSTTPSHPPGVPARPSSPPSAFPLVDELHSAELSFINNEKRDKVAHRYDVTLEPSSFTEEKFRLFCEYQRSVHKDDDKSRQGFKSFLCETPLKRQRIRYSKQPPAHLPAEYGSYHQMYRVDGELIAVGVVDVLPYCVSSVYLMYSPKWETHSLGKLSALKEIALAQEMSAYGAPGMGYLYMGFYIHTCPKMKYKGQYAPSFLLDPEEYTWCPTEKAFPLLDKHLYVPFHDPTRASKINPGNRTTQDDDASAEPIDEAEDDMSDTEEADSASAFQLPDEVLARVEIGQISGGTIYTMPAQRSRSWTNPYTRGLITRAASLLGGQVAPSVILLST